MTLLEKFIMALIIIILVYLCVYAVINRICKCVEHHTEYKYCSRVDIDWVRNHPPAKHYVGEKEGRNSHDQT